MSMSLSDLVAQAYTEDLPKGDVTTDHLGVDSKMGSAKLIAKEDLVLSGTEAFLECMSQKVPGLEINWFYKNGDMVLKDQCVALIQCNLVELLQAERVALNFLGRLSGISTLTRCFVKAIGENKTKILDTRKTTPLLRRLEKQAVVDGGGDNHRMNLSDMAMLKENHLRLMGGNIADAVSQLRKRTPDTKIVVETTNMDEVKQAIAAGCDRILLDNMTTDEMKQAVQTIPGTIESEASGNMSLERVGEVAEAGVDFISVGALTHSAPCADFSLLFNWEDPVESN